MLNKNSHGGFILLEVIFLVIIVSFVAMIFLNSTAKINNSDSALRLAALNLANEQFAELESRAAAGILSEGSYNFLGVAEDLKNFGIYQESDLAEKTPTNFSVSSTVKNYSGNLFTASVAVEWTFAGKNHKLELEKILRMKLSE